MTAAGIPEPDRSVTSESVPRRLGERAAGDVAAAGVVGRGLPGLQLLLPRGGRVVLPGGEVGALGVGARVEGQRRLYALDPRPLAELDAWLAPYRRLWAQRLDALDTEIARGRRARAAGEGR